MEGTFGLKLGLELRVCKPPGVRCDCESELKMEMPAQTNIALRHALVVVTGASTGIGAATARELAKRGFHVLASVRRDADADAIRSANFEPTRLAITNQAEIAMLVNPISDDPNRRPQ